MILLKRKNNEIVNKIPAKKIYFVRSKEETTKTKTKSPMKKKRLKNSRGETSFPITALPTTSALD